MAELVGRQVVSVRGERIGKIDRLCSHEHEESQWAIVKLGVFGFRSALIPLHDAQQDGDRLQIVYEKDHVRKAPDVETGDGQLSDEEADLLHGYYGLERVTGLTAPGADDDIELPREARDANPPGLDEGADSPLTKRRHKRMKELGVPSARDESGARRA